jgi:hypothetical protein
MCERDVREATTAAHEVVGLAAQVLAGPRFATATPPGSDPAAGRGQKALGVRVAGVRLEQASGEALRVPAVGDAGRRPQVTTVEELAAARLAVERLGRGRWGEPGWSRCRSSGRRRSGRRRSGSRVVGRDRRRVGRARSRVRDERDSRWMCGRRGTRVKRWVRCGWVRCDRQVRGQVGCRRGRRVRRGRVRWVRCG